MANHRHALIWIDHQIAKVFHLDADTSESTVIHATGRHQHLHHKANSIDSGHAPVDKAYLEMVAAAVTNAQSILITGPASAKTELHHYLETQHPGTAAKISAVEPLDHPTNAQLLAHARRFYAADLRP